MDVNIKVVVESVLDEFWKKMALVARVNIGIIILLKIRKCFRIIYLEPI